MKFTRPLLILLVLLLLCPLLWRPVSAASEQDILRQILVYYGYHQEAAETDIENLLQQLEQLNPQAAQNWRLILDKWRWAAEEYSPAQNIIPGDLPQDDSLCIIVMGFRLNYGGAMEAELIRRLEVALAFGEKYPNAYIACTGGGTAPGNSNMTEAGQMAAWLEAKGISPQRIIVENRSLSTEENALKTYQILSRDYPQITSIALVSSDYHLRRCHLLFTAGILLMDLPYSILADASFDAGYQGTLEGYREEMRNLGKMVGLDLLYAKEPDLTELTGIFVGGTADYLTGEALNLTVTAQYSNGFTRNVTHLCQITGFNSEYCGTQELLIQYEENGILRECAFSIDVTTPPTTIPVTQPPVTEPAATQPPVEISQTTPPSPPRLLPVVWMVCALVLLTPAALWIVSHFRHGKYEKRRRK